MSWQTLALIVCIAFVDFVVLVRVRLRRWRTGPFRYDPERRSDDFEVLVPIFGHIKYLKNADALEPYGERVVLCTTDKESPEFYASLHAEAARRGFRVIVAPTSTAPVRTSQFVILSQSVVGHVRPGGGRVGTARPDTTRDEIVRNTGAMLEARTIIYLDGDTVPEVDLRVVAGAFEDSGLDVSSVRVVPSKTDTLAERLQNVEYELAMDARLLYPWLTSGAATIGRSDAMLRIMANHSLFFSGGDIELGKLARMLGLRVGHLPFLFLTDVPDTLQAWFRQRSKGWCIGKFRHSIVNLDRPGWRSPFFTFYSTFVIYGLLPFRWWESITRPWILAVVWAVYCVLLFLIAPRRFRLWTMAFPIFAYVQVMFAIPLGGYQYCRYAIRTGHLGRIKIRDPATLDAPARPAEPVAVPRVARPAPTLPPPAVAPALAAAASARPEHVEGRQRRRGAISPVLLELLHWHDTLEHSAPLAPRGTSWSWADLDQLVTGPLRPSWQFASGSADAADAPFDWEAAEADLASRND